MTDLLRAGFARLWRAPVFWLGVVFMACCGGLVCQNAAYKGSQYEIVYFMSDLCRYHCLFTVFLPPVFCALFLGTEHDHGVIRNKLIAGKSRPAVYLSSLILSLAACFLMIGAYFVPVLIAGPFVTEGLGMTGGMLALIVIGELLMAAALCALCTLGSMLISRKALLAVLLLLAVIGGVVFSSTVEGRLQEPEYYQGMMMTVNGELVDTSHMENPRFLTGTKREVCQFIADFLPTGQALEYNFGSYVHPVAMCLYSLLILAASTGAGQYNFGNVVHPVALCLYSLFILCASTAGGLAAFRRKDLK